MDDVLDTTQETAPQATTPASYLDDEGCAWIPETRYGLLMEKVEKLNKRAAKLDCPPIVITQVGERFVPIRNEHTDLVVRHRRDVRAQISGSAPQVAGWSFVARVAHGEGGNIVSKAPDEQQTKLDEALWIADPVCEHCQTTRRRKDTFILREIATGTVKQVGRNCLADFLRSEDVEMALAFWKFLHEVEKAVGGGDDDDEGFGGGGGGRHYYDIQSVLHAAARAIRVDGWTSRAQARESQDTERRCEATADTVGFILDPPWSKYDESVNTEIKDRLARYEAKEADSKVAADTLEWVRRRLDPQSDYERNLKVALTPDYMDPRNMGLVVSAAQAWIRLEAKRDSERRPAVQAPSEHLGNIGDRLRDVPCRVVLTKTWEGQYGLTNLLVFVDASGHELKWFASGDQELEVGKEVVLTGTVKGHDEYKGRKTTVLSHCKVQIP